MGMTHGVGDCAHTTRVMKMVYGSDMNMERGNDD